MNDIDKRLEDGYSRAMGSVSYDDGVYIGAYVIHLRKQLQTEREEKERLKQEKARIMKLYTEQLEHDGNQLDKYEKALKEITKVGWSDSFGGGIQYSGESHGDCIKIARAALSGDRE